MLWSSSLSTRKGVGKPQSGSALKDKVASVPFCRTCSTLHLLPDQPWMRHVNDGRDHVLMTLCLGREVAGIGPRDP